MSVEFRPLRLESGDLLLLCTDGLTDLAQDHEILSAVLGTAPLQAACDALVQLALERGGRDNVTVVIGSCDFVQLESLPQFGRPWATASHL